MPALSRFSFATLCFSFLLASYSVSCAAPKQDASKGEIKKYPMHGQVAGLDPAEHVATIKHDEIPGFMGAMTMGYSIKDPAEFGKLKVGETFNGTVYVQGDELWVGDIHQAKP